MTSTIGICIWTFVSGNLFKLMLPNLSTARTAHTGAAALAARTELSSCLQLGLFAALVATLHEISKLLSNMSSGCHVV